MSMKRRVVFALPLLIGISILLCHTASSAFAQILITFSKNNLEMLQKKYKNSPDSHLMIREDLQMALLWQPKNAEILDNIGRYSLLRVGSQAELSSEELNGMAAYRKAINMRPGRADLWRRLAYTKALAEQFDAEFYRAYQRAFYYGGWEYHVNQTLMQIGMAHWHAMDVTSRSILEQVVVRSYTVRPYTVLQMAQQYGQLETICLWVRGEKDLHKICEKELSKTD